MHGIIHMDEHEEMHVKPVARLSKVKSRAKTNSHYVIQILLALGLLCIAVSLV